MAQNNYETTVQSTPEITHDPLYKQANILCKGYGRFPWRMIASYNNHFKYLSLVSEEVHTRTPCTENEEGNHVWEWKMKQNMEEETTCCNHIIFVSYYDTNKLNTLRDS